MIEELNELLTLLLSIDVNKYTVFFALVLTVGIIIWKYMDDNRFNQYYKSMLEEKNKEIERLADDNRRYRDIYLNNKGFAEEQIAKMSAAEFKGE